MGVIQRKSSQKPTFKTKTITSLLEPIVIIPTELVELSQWLCTYYPSSMGQLMSLILPTTLLQKSRNSRAPQSDATKPTKPPVLTTDQAHVVAEIMSKPDRMHLLHGETGSGKTRVYSELIQKTLATKKSAILLTPEIGLTPQLTHTIEAHFPGKTVVLHSNLTPAERRNRWLQIASSPEPLIIIGPRSALFAPLQSVGIIILDEAHDTAYKQEQSPFYMTSRVAAKLAELHGAKVIMGTATPAVSDYYTFLEKGLPIHTLSQRAIRSDHTANITTVDLRNRDDFSRSNWLSNILLEKIEQNLGNQTQSLLFLNRRGTARLVLCQTCGWQALCPRCDVPLVYHNDHHELRCHTCGYTTDTPSSCPTCQSTELTFKSIGTKALATEIARLFPKASLLRFDSDNSKNEQLEKKFKHIQDGNVDIIIGTQMLAKGLDLPKLGLVGIVMADTSLTFPDYTAEERMFQLINQVAGRADRGHRDTDVIVQSYHPDNPLLHFALKQDYQAFYEYEINERKTYHFPPFRYVLKIKIERSTAKSAETTTNRVRQMILDLGYKIELSDAMPSFSAKVNNRYRWQLIIKAVDRTILTDIIHQLPANVSYDIDPTNLL